MIQPNIYINQYDIFKEVLTLLELFLVVIILAVLSAVWAPTNVSPKLKLMSKGGARQLQSIMAMARSRAMFLNKPIQVVINCSHPEGFDSCFIDLLPAEQGESMFSGGDRGLDGQMVLEPNLAVARPNFPRTFEGSGATQKFKFAVFTPLGQVIFDPRPPELFLYHQDQKSAEKKGWKIQIIDDTGRISLDWSQILVP
jgi:hypothetical protein